MVRTNDKRGIECDLCGAEYKENFIYYSGILDKVDVNAARATSITEVDKRFLDIDMCQKCWQDMKERILDVINKREQKAKKIATSKSTPDEWSTQDGTIRTPGDQNRPGGFVR